MRFFVGDDNGQLKSVKCSKSPKNEWDVEASILDGGGDQGKVKAVQRIAVKRHKIALARADGTVTLFSIEPDVDIVHQAHEWQETRFRREHQYIGLDITDSGNVMSCTSAGHLCLQHPSNGQDDIAETFSETTFVPSRLCELIVSDDANHFAYGGDEVEVSLWDTTRAFDKSRRLLPAVAVGTKRKKNNSELIEGEIWRAKNVSNDNLNLRQPVHNTALTFLFPICHKDVPSHHILAGTRIGSVRRYDTRAAKRPVADWKDVGKMGGIRKVQRGAFEHEAFVADHGSNLFALDLRTGRVLYAYGGIGGAISSLSPISSYSSPSLVASTSLDRYFRLHSAYKPPNEPRGSANGKGEVLSKHWLKSAASCVVWDGVTPGEPVMLQDGKEDDNVWEAMDNISEQGSCESSTSELENKGYGQRSKKPKVL